MRTKKTNGKNQLLLPALMASLALLPAGLVTGQTFTLLHTLAPIVVVDNGNFTFSLSNLDGATPTAGFITNSSGTTLYGTASSGGVADEGTVFAINTDGTGFTNLHRFTALISGTNGDGAIPYGGLILSGNILYGTTSRGGSGGVGAVFALNTDGTGFTNLYSFAPTSPDSFGNQTNSDGASPYAGLILSGNTLYGAASSGGSSGAGTVFALNTDGAGFTNLHSFSAIASSYPYANDDGANPQAGLVLSGNTLYGTASGGGSGGVGAVFALNTDGTGFTNLHTFTPTSPDSFGNQTNSDGATPYAGLILSGNTLYGTTYYSGGSGGVGTVFAINTDGTGFTNLHSFARGVYINFGNNFTNSEGARPKAGLLLSGDTLYGTTSIGGSPGAGTVFALKTNGTAFTNVYAFSALNPSALPTGAATNRDGARPNGGLIVAGKTLYGMASAGGSGGVGTIFSLSFPPQLTITFPGDRPVLSWPISNAGFSYTGYYLQYTRGTNSPAVWVNLVYVPTIINGQFEVVVPWTLFLGQSSSSFRLRQ